MYQNPYNYPNSNYQNQYYDNYYNNRAPNFANKIGTYHMLIQPLSLPTGYTIPANTRIFIHNVTITTSGEELVTIVAPILKGGNWVNETIKDISAKQL